MSPYGHPKLPLKVKIGELESKIVPLLGQSTQSANPVWVRPSVELDHGRLNLRRQLVEPCNRKTVYV